MKKLVIKGCTNPNARTVWIDREKKKECVAMLNGLPYVESASGILGSTQIVVILSELAENKDIEEMSALLREIAGPEEE